MSTFSHLQSQDPDVFNIVQEECARQRDGLELIPSENHTSPAVLESLATTLSDKYAEGYPGRRYYSGNAVVDKIELLAQARAKSLFGVPYVNVQPYSGSPANLAVYLATCEPGDPIMGLDLLNGGHLTHGWKHSMTARYWKSVPYHLTTAGDFDFNEIRTLAFEHKPKILWCGGTAMPRTIPFAKFAEIADEIGALLVADISHIAGLIAGGVHESPVAHAHIVTTTTHKTLRGPRGALIMVTEKGLAKDPQLGEKIDKAIIPGLQGGPHMNTIAGIAVALKEASQPAFHTYAARVVENAKSLGAALISRGFTLACGGTDNHLLLLDLSSTGPGRGKFLTNALEAVGLYANMNTVPGDQGTALWPSGLRLGTPAATTRGMGHEEMEQIAGWIAEIMELIKDIPYSADKDVRTASLAQLMERLANEPRIAQIKTDVTTLCHRFPIPE